MTTLTSSDPGEGLKVYLSLLSNQIAAEQAILFRLSEGFLRAFYRLVRKLLGATLWANS
jgi:hypothetical protein